MSFSRFSSFQGDVYASHSVIAQSIMALGRALLVGIVLAAVASGLALISIVAFIYRQRRLRHLIRNSTSGSKVAKVIQ